MRPNVISISPYATSDGDALHVASTPAAGGVQELVLDGAFVVGGVGVMDAAREVFINFGADYSARKIVIFGTDSKGNQIIEAVQGNNSGFELTERAFTTVTQILVDGDAPGNVELGTGASAVVHTSWFPLDYLQDFKVALVLNIPTGT